MILSLQNAFQAVQVKAIQLPFLMCIRRLGFTKTQNLAYVQALYTCIFVDSEFGIFLDSSSEISKGSSRLNDAAA